jgi:hypothetical protein
MAKIALDEKIPLSFEGECSRHSRNIATYGAKPSR